MTRWPAGAQSNFDRRLTNEQIKVKSIRNPVCDHNDQIIWFLKYLGCLDVLRRRFAAALLPRLFGNNVPGHTTRAPPWPVGFEPATNCIKFYAIAKLDKPWRHLCIIIICAQLFSQIFWLFGFYIPFWRSARLLPLDPTSGAALVELYCIKSSHSECEICLDHSLWTCLENVKFALILL